MSGTLKECYINFGLSYSPDLILDVAHFCVVWCGGLCDFSVSPRSKSFFCSILGYFYSIWGAH